MSRRTVSYFLLAWLCVTWAAVVVRSDRFPLTWAPMYSAWTPHQITSNRVVDTPVYMRGMLVTRRDGRTLHVGASELNISRNHMYRLYYQRTFGKPPVKHKHGNENLDAFNRWIRGLRRGEDNFPNDMGFRVFQSLNKTLGHEPDDPAFVIRVQASFDRMYRPFDDLSDVWRRTHEADLRWDEAWRERW